MSTECKRSPVGWQRIVVGLLATIFLLLGATMYFYGAGSASGLHGIFVRLGVVLGAIWLAMPQLGKLTKFQSVGAVVTVISLIVLAASRPNLFRVAAILLAVGLTLNWALKWMSLVAKVKK